jgi:crotonobetainyl-CoA:carnitine CoA-transferase CaiB-like acyl-CoA transferase
MGALDGIRILELARVLPGEFCTMLLGDMGADVTKVEAPAARSAPTRSAFDYVNRNKKSLTLDLKDGKGKALFLQLAAQADVIVEGFRPGVMARLGADYATISEINPRIVYCSLSGFGQQGPYRDRPAHDLNFLSLAGVLNLIGEAGRRPVIPLNLVADYGGASLHGALGIMLALFARERTGKGQHVDVAYLDTAISLLAATPDMRYLFTEGRVPRRGEGSLSGTYPYYSVYGTRDGKLITVACTEPWLWKNFCIAIGRPDLERFARQPEHFTRAANAEERQARDDVDAIMHTRDRDDWHETLATADVCVGKVYEPMEVATDPQVVHRQMVLDLTHPDEGNGRQFGVALKLSGTPGSVRSLAPQPGQHSAEILQGIGVAEDEIRSLREAGVI